MKGQLYQSRFPQDILSNSIILSNDLLVNNSVIIIRFDIFLKLLELKPMKFMIDEKFDLKMMLIFFKIFKYYHMNIDQDYQ